MTIALKYGSPPELEDCVDIGTVPPGVAPFKVANEGDFAGIPGMLPVMGKTIPPHRRAWLTVAHYRRNEEVPKPYVVRIPGLGKLVYDDHDKKLGIAGDNWAVLEENKD